MDTYFFDRLTYQKYYNCTAYNIEQVPFKDRQNILIGSVYIGLFFVFEILYFPCIMAIYRRINQSCYKIMFFMGIVDVLCLPIVGLLHGYLGVIGAVFCTTPDLIYITGCVSMGLWACEGMAATLLAVDSGNLTWLWLSIPAIYGTCFGFFGKPVLFSSIEMAWFLNPHYAYLPNTSAWYHSDVHIFNNTFIMFVLTSLYVTFAVLLWYKSWSYMSISGDRTPSTLMRSQRMSFLQVLILSVVHVNASGVYCYMQYFNVGSFVTHMAMFGWFLAHGIPPIIYLALNKSIRNDCIQTFKRIFKIRANTIKMTVTSVNVNNFSFPG
ncbi:serpentine type 7TM GPCR chemoreceptor srt domain-containing protein [Ditylenchus destructor]|nr:serpentine type 7TM GPCR chemoreceptor srt domain-containing protein [Ditylenchus destructor]